jgi:predicted membrane chloride channel (bestrophin family)
MFIGDTIPWWRIVERHRWSLGALLGLSVVAAVMEGVYGVAMPVLATPFAVVGGSLAILLAFRSGAAYDRVPLLHAALHPCLCAGAAARPRRAPGLTDDRPVFRGGLVFLVLPTFGELIEMPFGTGPSGLPLDAITRNLEVQGLQAVGREELPPDWAPSNGVPT